MRNPFPAMAAIAFALLVATLTMSAVALPAIAQEDAVSFEISHHHVGMSVPNAEESAAWYGKMLGFEVVARMKDDGVNKMNIVHIKRGNSYIELFEVKDAKPLPEYRRNPDKDLTVHGLVHMAFQVPDVMAAVRELKAKGAEIAREPVDTPGIAFVFIRDNAGNCFELIQYKNR